MTNNSVINLEAFHSHFSESRLWNKIARVARKAGIKVVYVALLLYYMARDPAIPMREKMKIYGALGYFILPIDMIPDTFVALGFSDDFAALAYALYSLAKYITPEVQARAEAKLQEWFGDYDSTEIAGLLPMPAAD